MYISCLSFPKSYILGIIWRMLYQEHKIDFDIKLL